MAIPNTRSRWYLCHLHPTLVRVGTTPTFRPYIAVAQLSHSGRWRHPLVSWRSARVWQWTAQNSQCGDAIHATTCICHHYEWAWLDLEVQPSYHEHCFDRWSSLQKDDLVALARHVRATRVTGFGYFHVKTWDWVLKFWYMPMYHHQILMTRMVSEPTRSKSGLQDQRPALHCYHMVKVLGPLPRVPTSPLW